MRAGGAGETPGGRRPRPRRRDGRGRGGRSSGPAVRSSVDPGHGPSFRDATDRPGSSAPSRASGPPVRLTCTVPIVTSVTRTARGRAIEVRSREITWENLRHAVPGATFGVLLRSARGWREHRAGRENGPIGWPRIPRHSSRISACWSPAAGPASCRGPIPCAKGSQKSSNPAYIASMSMTPGVTSRSPVPVHRAMSSPRRKGRRASSGAAGSNRRAAFQKVRARAKPSASNVQAATVPPRRTTLVISVAALPASVTNERTSCDSDAEKERPANGRASAGATRTSTPGTRARQAAAKGSEGSTADTDAAPNRPARTEVRAPGPAPTSSTGPSTTPAKSRKRGASSRE